MFRGTKKFSANPFFWLLLILFFLPLPAGADKNSVFRKNINDVLLIINAPESYISDNRRIFIDKNKNLGVNLNYGEFKAQANQIAFDLKENVIELADGFKGSLEQYYIEGNYLRINPRTGNYIGYNLKFGYLVAYFYGKEFQFYGDKISVDKIATSPLYYPVFRLYIDKLEIYPGYRLAYRNTLKLFNLPFYYIPLYMNEGRRTYFNLPFPALEVKSNVFHGISGSLHSHYFINPSLYGNVSLKLSEKDGAGGSIQQLVRLSDHQQLELKLLDWERAPTQANLSYVLHLFDNPRISYEKLTFRERQELEENVSAVQPKVIFRSDYTINEEINRSVIDRYPDASIMVKAQGILYDHIYTFTPSIYYGKIKEKKIYPEDADPLVVDRDYERFKGNINLSYFLETPYIKPYIKKALLAMDYEHSLYKPIDRNKGRISGSLTVRRPIFKNLGLFYEANLNKILLDYGQSPFYFEEYGRLNDNGVLQLYLQTKSIIAGNHLTYDFTNGQFYNEIYFLGVKAGKDYAVIKYDRRQKSWEFTFMSKEPAF